MKIESGSIARYRPFTLLLKPTCETGKLRYADAADAQDGISAMAYKAARGEAKPRDYTRAYECHICDGWHLTSHPLLAHPRSCGENTMSALSTKENHV